MTFPPLHLLMAVNQLFKAYCDVIVGMHLYKMNVPYLKCLGSEVLILDFPRFWNICIHNDVCRVLGSKYKHEINLCFKLFLIWLVV